MKRLAMTVMAAAVFGSPANARPQSVLAEAKEFMAGYARDIVMGDRSALSSRYDPAGVFLLVGGGREYAPHRRIVQDYEKQWIPPSSFGWLDLHFDAAGRNAGVVNGRFVWGGANGLQTFTYTGFLRRRRGKLTVRLEDETLVSSPMLQP